MNQSRLLDEISAENVVLDIKFGQNVNEEEFPAQLPSPVGTIWLRIQKCGFTALNPLATPRFKA